MSGHLLVNTLSLLLFCCGVAPFIVDTLLTRVSNLTDCATRVRVAQENVDEFVDCVTFGDGNLNVTRTEEFICSDDCTALLRLNAKRTQSFLDCIDVC